MRRSVLMVIAGAREAGFRIHAVDTATDTVYTKYETVADGMPMGLAAHVRPDGSIEVGPLPGSPEYTGRLLERVEDWARAFASNVEFQTCTPTARLEALAEKAGVVLPVDYGLSASVTP